MAKLNHYFDCDCARCARAADVAIGIVERYQRGERETIGRSLAAADPGSLFAVAAVLAKLIDGPGLAELHHLILSEIGTPTPAALELTPMNRPGPL